MSDRCIVVVSHGRSRTRRLFTPAALLGFVALFAGGLPAGAQPSQQLPPAANELQVEEVAEQARAAAGEASADNPAPAETASDAGPVSVEQSVAGLLDVHVRDIDIGTLLEMLSYEAQRNIVSSASVHGQVSANLYGVTLEEALEAVLRPNNYIFHKNGTTIFVGKPEEIDGLLPPPEPRVFKLKYIPAGEAIGAVKATLGSDVEVVKGDAEDDAGSEGMTRAGLEYIIVTAREDDLARVADILAQLDLRPRQVLVEATVLRATLNEDNQFGIDFTMLGGVDFQDVSSTSNASADLTTGQLPPNDLQSTTFNVNTAFNANFPAGGFTFGLIKDSIGGFVRALEDVTDVVVVANPKIVALNRQEAQVIVGRRDGYVTTTVTETAAIEKIEFLETGTQVRFTPLINEDGTVRLFVHPKDSNGGLTAANLPFEETTEAQADVLIDDGDTILIGGLFRERSLNSQSQVPVLGNVPGLGLLFGNRFDQTTREEVVILLTVHVLKETEREQAYFRGLLEDIERVRVGHRRGLLGSGRERLAQAFYHEALEQLAAGDHDRALLNLYMTLHNQPRMLPALKLREKLLNKRYWSEEGWRMRTFTLGLLQLEHLPPGAVPDAPFGRPEPVIPPPPTKATPEDERPPQVLRFEAGEPIEVGQAASFVEPATSARPPRAAKKEAP